MSQPVENLLHSPKGMMKLRLTSRIVLIFVLFVALLLATVGVLSYRGGSESLKDAAVSELLSVAVEKEAALDQWIEDRVSELEQLPIDTDLVKRAETLVAAVPGSDKARSAHSRFIKDLEQHIGGADDGYIELFVMEPQGGRVVISTSPAEEGKSKIGHPYFDNGKAGSYLQAPYISADLGTLAMTASVPLRSPDGRVVAVLAGRLDLAAMNAIAQRRTGLRLTDDSFLVNSERFLVSPPRFLPKTAVAERQIDTIAVRRCIERNNGVILELDYRAVPVIAVFRWIAKRQLGLIVKIDQAEALAPARAFGRSVLLISGLAVLATAALALLLARTITKPLRALHVSVGRFAEGEIQEPLPESSGDELGLLAREINRMQVRIHERTAELAQTNQALHAENTERKRAEESSRHSEEKFRELADNITDVFYVQSLDMQEIQFISKAYETVWGFPMQSLYDNPHQWTDSILPEDRERVLATFAGLREKEPSISVEYRIMCPDGTVRWIHDRAFQVRKTAGSPIRTVGFATDITKLKQAAESLEKSEANKSAIVESALDCIITMDAKGDITEFNPSAEATFGHQRSAVIGKKFADVIVPPSWRAIHLQRMDVQLPAGEAEDRSIGKRIERSALRADGTEFPVEFAMSAATIRGEQCVTVFIRDITERKNTELRVEALHKELLDSSRRAGMAEIATGVLHNVGNVLNSINVSTSIVVERLQKSRASRLSEVVKLLAEHAADLPQFLTVDERGRNLPQFLAQLAAHLSRETHEIAEEMLAVAENVEHIKEIVSTQQSYAGSFGVLEPLDLRDSIEDALRIHGGALARHHVEVVRKFEPIATVVVDKNKVLQILVNLISNAKYAMTDSPVKTLTIKTYPSSDGGIQVSIHDTGCGIVAENITRIFAHGFTTKKDGHGFGLHSSALAARQMNAMLIAHSDGVGQGAVFTLVFPPAIPTQIAA